MSRPLDCEEADFRRSLSERFKLLKPDLLHNLSDGPSGSSGSSSSVMVALEGLLEPLTGSEMDLKNSAVFRLVMGLCSITTVR